MSDPLRTGPADPHDAVASFPDGPSQQSASDGAPGFVVVGRYKLLESIGEGGMGIVWMAQQTEPIKRLVAVKLIKAGMDSKTVLARFEAERQALSMMDHPNIARVYDVGTTAEGRPFFVMELVKGTPITEFCDQRKLTARQRLELFASVCKAIQHAHQKGVIHRDIKPSNVLVALYDDQPVAKVIDFGLAKALSQPLTERTLHTGFGQVVGTPVYMSPEQATFNQLDIDTRSDIYSLGVLLYELLTGTTPIEEHRFKAAAMLEMLRVVREEEPPRPSTRLSSTDSRGKIAEVRGTEPECLTRELRGELDWIALKALEKDRARRYESASDLAADVQRYLSGEAVQAHPPSAVYQFRKFMRRHRGAISYAAVVFLLVVGGGGAFAWWQGHQNAVRREERANREREERDRNIRNAEAIRSLTERCETALRGDDIGIAKAAMAEIDRRQTEGGADDLQGRIAQCRDDLLLLEELNRIDDLRWSRPVVNGQSLDGINWEAAAKAWAKALPLHGVTIREDDLEETARRVKTSLVRERLLGALDLWLRSEKEHVALVKALHACDPDAYRDSVRAAISTQSWDRLRALATQREALEQPVRFAIVLGSFDKVKSVFDPVIASDRRHEILKRAWLYNPTNTGILIALGELSGGQEAIRWYQAAVAANRNNARAWQKLGYSLISVDKQTASACYREAIRIDPTNGHNYVDLACLLTRVDDERINLLREGVRNDPTNADCHLNLGHHLAKKGKLDEAIVEIREGDRLMGKTWYHPPDAIGDYLLRKGDVAGAIKEYQEAVRRARFEETHRKLAFALCLKGDFDNAIAQYREALKGANPKLQAAIHQAIGATLIQKGDLDGAVAAYRESLRLDPNNPTAIEGLIGVLARNQTEEHVLAEYVKLAPKAERHHILSHVAVAYLRAGKQGEMESLIRQTLAERKDTIEYSHSLAYLAESLVEKEKWADADPVLRECVTIREKLVPDSWWTPYTGSLLGLALARQKKYKEAEPRLVQCHNQMKKHYPPSKPWDLGVPDQRRATVAQLVLLYEALKKPDEAAKWRDELVKYPADRVNTRTEK